MPETFFSLSHRARLIVMGVTAIVILALVNYEIMQKEMIIRYGDTVLLPLAPRDPRSLLQGDYMALRYAMADNIARAAKDDEVTDGHAVIDVEVNGKARFVALYKGQPLTRTQKILRFRKRGGSVRIASDAYFFEEGGWMNYREAAFGEIKVSEEGDSVLVGLRDAAGHQLGKLLH